MTRSSSLWSERAIFKRIRTGHGGGQLNECKPWLTAQEFSSLAAKTQLASLEVQECDSFASNIKHCVLLAQDTELRFVDYWEQVLL